MRRALPDLAAVLLSAAAVAVSACGEDRSHLLPATSADRLSSRLDEVRSAVADGDCEAAVAALARAESAARQIPGTVSRALRERINEGIDRLRVTVPVDCREAAAEEETETTETTTTETVPPTTPTQTTPQPTTPTTQPTTPTQTQTPTTPTQPQPQTPTTPTPNPGGVSPEEETP